LAAEEKKPNNNDALANATSAPAAVTPPVAPAPGTTPTAASPANSAAVVENPNLEDGALSEKGQLLLVQPYNDSLAKLAAQFEQNENLRHHEVSSAKTVETALKLMPCLVFGAIVKPNDVVKYIQMMKTLREHVKAGRIKFIILSKINNPTVMSMFASHGCKDYIVEPIPERSLFFKVNLQTKSLIAQRKQMRHLEIKKRDLDSKQGKSKGGGEMSLTNDEGEINNKLREEAAGEVASKDDVWVFRKNKPKRQGGKWTMRMKGPDEKDGEWAEVGKNEDGSAKWRFLEKDENGKLQDPKEAKNKPGWEFTGDKPTFQNGEWQFEGKKPELSLVDEKGEKKSSKVKAEGDGLVLAKDSETALKKADEGEKRKAEEKEKKKNNLFGEGRAKAAEDEDAGKEATAKAADGESDDEDAKKRGGKLEGKGKDGASGKKLKTDGSASDDEDEEDDDDELAGILGQNSKNFLKKKRKKDGDASVDDETDDEEANAIGPDGKKKKKDKDSKTSQGEDGDDADEDESAESLGANAKNFLKKKRKKDSEEDGEESDESKSASAAIDPKTGKPVKKEASEKDPKTGKALTAKEKEEAKKKGGLSDLAGLAMNLEDEPTEVNNKINPDGTQATDGKDDAKTLNIEDAEWEGHDLSPEDREKFLKGVLGEDKIKKMREERDAKKKKAKDGDSEEGAGKKKRRDGDSTEGASEGEDEAGELDPNAKNFLKKKRNLDDDSSGNSTDESGGNLSTAGGGENKKNKWGGQDSDLDGDSDGKDKLIEIDGPNGKLNVKKFEDETFELPEAELGVPNGIWENAGADKDDPQGGKWLVYLEPAIRQKKIDDLRTIKTWWIFKGGRPSYLSMKKAYVFRGGKPQKIDGFANLPKPVQEFLLSISPHTARLKKLAEDQIKAKKAAETETKRAAATLEIQKKKAAIAEIASAAAEAKAKTKKTEEASKVEEKAAQKEESAVAAEAKPESETVAETSIEAKTETEAKSETETGASASSSDKVSEDETAKPSLLAPAEEEKGAVDLLQVPESEAEPVTPEVKAAEGEAANAESQTENDAPPVLNPLAPLATESNPESAELNADAAAATGVATPEIDPAAPAELPPVENSPPPFAGETLPTTAPEFRKTKLKLPSAPLVAMYLSELLLSCRGNVVGAIKRFCHFVSKGAGQVKVTVYLVNGIDKIQVVASSHDRYPVGHQMNLTEWAQAKATLDERIPKDSTTGDRAILCPIRGVRRDVPAVGLLVIEPAEEAQSLEDEKLYFTGLAQALRGSLIHLAIQGIDSINQEAA